MRDHSASRVLVVAVWFGLLTGLFEGIGLLAAQKLGWLEWETLQRGVAPEILWIAPVVDLALFGSVAFMLLVVGRIFPRLAIIRISVLVFAFMTVADAVALTGRILIYAVVTLAAGVAITLVRWFGNHEEAAMRFWRKSVGAVVAAAAMTLVGVEGGLRPRGCRRPHQELPMSS
jgi:hypothetical protein